MRRFGLLAVVVVLLVVLSRAMTAQLDPGLKIYLYQEGVRVGEVYVPERATTDVRYVEHWVLYGKYKYPGPQYLKGLVIKAEPSAMPYASEEDFFRRVPWNGRSKYIRVTAIESTTVPTAAAQ